MPSTGVPHLPPASTPPTVLQSPQLRPHLWKTTGSPNLGGSGRQPLRRPWLFDSGASHRLARTERCRPRWSGHGTTRPERARPAGHAPAQGRDRLTSCWWRSRAQAWRDMRGSRQDSAAERCRGCRSGGPGSTVTTGAARCVPAARVVGAAGLRSHSCRGPTGCATPRRRTGCGSKGEASEADLPTQQSQARQTPWLPAPDVDAGRSCRAPRPAPQGPSPSVRVRAARSCPGPRIRHRSGGSAIGVRLLSSVAAVSAGVMGP